MSADASRRGFLRTGLAAGGGLLVGIGFAAAPASSAGAGAGPAAAGAPFAPNAFVRIDVLGQVTLVMPFVEMGQGTYTSIPMLIAEELEVPLDSVRLQHAPADDTAYANALFGFQMTGGSSAIRAAYAPLRRAGAVARLLLVEAAARRWQVGVADCRAERGEVVHVPSGRRLAYGALVNDAAMLPAPQQVLLKPPAQFRLIGTPARRLDTPQKVDGSARFGIDALPPGVRFAALAQAPAYGGTLRRLDDSAARAVRGVRQVVQLADAVAVVADHMGAARKGLAALDLVWDDGPNARTGTAEIVAAMRAASRGAAATARSDGDAAHAIAAAATRIEAAYTLPMLAHAAMEPVNCTVHLTTDRCEVWTGTQVMGRARDAAARASGLALDRVVVHNHLLGGGFGRRLDVDFVTRAVQIARHVQGPVKVVWSREEDIRRDLYRPCFHDTLSAGLDAQGRIVGWRHRITGSSILKRWLPPAYQNGLDPDTVDGAVQPPYAMPNVLVEYVNHEPPQIPTAFWRGVGPTHNVFVVESFIDELAAAARRDPVAFRLSMLDGNPRARAVLQLAAERAGWGGPLPPDVGRGVALQQAFGTFMALVAEVQVPAAGEVRVRRVVCAVDGGVIVNPDTVRAQVESAVLFGASAALFGEITIERGRVQQSNFHDVRTLRMHEVPAIEVHIVASGEAPGGMGEPGTSGIAPAITNAIHAATGRRLRQLPVSRALAAGA